MTKYDVKRVPRELLEKLAYSLLDATKDPTCQTVSYCLEGDLVSSLKETATIPLRTLSEVDADIVELVRVCADWTSNYGGPGGKIAYASATFDKTRLHDKCKWPNQDFTKVLAGLLDEETEG